MSEAPISFAVEDIKFELEHENDIKSWLCTVAQAEQKKLTQLDYLFCSDDYLLDVNKTYLNHDYYTDIITFPLDKKNIEANIFISIDRVKENAQLYTQNFKDELHRVIVHGLLHLIGYNDKTPEDEKAMRKKEDDCLAMRQFV
ncbi:MAG: rRNA maturation RNase YbeY [Saprospiraceae bacterium]|nr:rRNA maturation RNase YbeY [Saprospiraceae bacterium]